MGGQETLAEKGGVDAVGVVAFAYETYTIPTKNNGVLGATLTLRYAGGGMKGLEERSRAPKKVSVFQRGLALIIDI